MRAIQYIVAVAIAAGMAACQEADPVASPGANTRLEVTSDPEGASILLDRATTGKTTNTTLFDLTTGSHEITVRLPGPGGRFYGYSADVELKGDSLHRVTGPLTMLCVSMDCITETRQYHPLNNIRASTVPNGALFFFDQAERGLVWPSTGGSGYASIGTPMIAAVAGTRDTLAFGIYDVDLMAGRPPAPKITTGDPYKMRQSFWIVPIEQIRFSTAPSIRGIEVEEELIGTNAAADVAFIRLTFTNITNRPSYRSIDPFLPSGGITYTWVYVGFAIDAEVGLAEDDAVTYAPDLDMVYMYDFDFLDLGFPAGSTDRPGMIGLRLVQAPAGAAAKALTAWPRGSDWIAGDAASEKSGWYHFSGTRARGELSGSDVPGQHIGFAPNTAGDYRMSVSAGPLTLPPGQSASITVAVILAFPKEGTYSSGIAVPPENPMIPDRPIVRIAEDLLEKARNLVVPN